MRRVLIILLVTLLGACSRGPGEGVIHNELQQRLDAEFEPGLFAIEDLERLGSAPVPGQDEVFIYYVAALAFERDYHLTAWRGLNLGTLAVVLGATPEGVDGFSNAGNKRGDVLRVRGRLRYRDREGGWENVRHSEPLPDPQQAAADAMEGSGPAAVLRRVRELVQRTPTSSRVSRDGLIVDELRRALAQIDLGLAGYDGKLLFGTGWPGGSYNRFGTAFTGYAAAHGLQIFNYASEGSVENGHQLQDGELDFALLQSDVAEVLYKGWPEESQLPHPALRSMASLWPEALHIVTLDGSGIASFADLKDRRLAIGSRRSGTRFTALRVWLASGLGVPSAGQIREIGLGASIEALENGTVDAVFIAGAIPDPAIQALSQRRNDIRLVPIGQSALARLTSEYFAYYGTTIPERTYPGQAQPYRTLGFAALLLTSETTRDDDVRNFMALMVEGADVIARGFFRAGFVSPDTARLGISVPLHPGAEQYYAAQPPATDAVP